MFIEIFLLDAAGKIINEFISKIPTHLIEIITMTAIKIAKMFSIAFTFIPLLLARVLFKLTAFILLNK